MNPRPVLVCRYRGKPHRFFAKYKDPAIADARRAWRKIPGGAYPPEIDTPEKALACALRWYDFEMAHRAVTRSAPLATDPTSFRAVCEQFVEEVAARVRGADSTRCELRHRAVMLSSSPILGARPIAEHDEALVVVWVRHLLTEPQPRTRRPRDPLTVRNVTHVLGQVYRFARARGLFPDGRVLPSEGDEVRAEIAAALQRKAMRGERPRVACPPEVVSTIVASEKVSELRRTMTLAYFLTGMRPGELHGLRVADYREAHGILLLDVREQWALPRANTPPRLAPLKTVWSRRKIPVHSALRLQLDAWLTDGFQRHVGRAPEADDFLFPDAIGAPFRELHCDAFVSDLQRAGCATTHHGVRLELYSLRHGFATAARRAGVPSDVRDRLLGHRPRDTKTMYYEDEDLPLLAREIERIVLPGNDRLG